MLAVRPICKPGRTRKDGTNLIFIQYCLNGDKRVQGMLLQSHKKYIEIFPAIPSDWKNVSFIKLRAQEAFLIFCKKRKWELKKIKISA
jgi:hypothetical protein